jgi:hypothetical protein
MTAIGHPEGAAAAEHLARRRVRRAGFLLLLLFHSTLTLETSKHLPTERACRLDRVKANYKGQGQGQVDQLEHGRFVTIKKTI